MLKGTTQKEMDLTHFNASVPYWLRGCVEKAELEMEQREYRPTTVRSFTNGRLRHAVIQN